MAGTGSAASTTGQFSSTWSMLAFPQIPQLVEATIWRAGVSGDHERDRWAVTML